ncbi:MAG TPA: 3-methyl-2-oxobutanoate dehydrogenase subunit VorB [Candidatus Baltobacteraceae bacterium]|nr:3-methyl-2-oxobutanoate dehydrogenase subunit VorB [Candidatus Baltobacteraceae bacterium]
MARELIKGDEAIGEAAVQAGCKLFFGYPITPQTEILEYMSRRLPEIGGSFVQAESEVAAVNMVYGASGAGERVMTASSSPGISLMMEGISYLAGAELPAVIVNVMRAGPGLGSILPGQADYLQATKGGGHGDYRCLTLAPWSAQESADLVQDAFDLADYYRNPVLVLCDGLIGQLMEPVEFHDGRSACKPLAAKTWATTGWDESRPRAVINSLYLNPERLQAHNDHLQEKFAQIERDEVRWAALSGDGSVDVLLVAYGSAARVCATALDILAQQGIRAALLRPISLFPFPTAELRRRSEAATAVLVVELSAGQMIEDVRLAVQGRRPIHFLGRQGGQLVAPEEVAIAVRRIRSAAEEVAHV